ncbi:MAG: FAD-binding oxidoreductase, partial [Propionibacteriales bacterium]|nr:FAD-binding oxidoreductase [Propionibacteriales bacterium]
SFTHSTLGGWVATRSSGMQSDKYGDISDICKGVRVVQPGTTTVVRPLPSTSSGPSIREMVLGSEGRLGVITEVWAQVHRQPEQRVVHAYMFPTFEAGVEAMRLIAESDASPSITRVSDARESAFSFATKKEGKGVGQYLEAGLMKFLDFRGWDLDQLALSFVGYEGSPTHVSMNKALCDKIIKGQGGIGVGTGPGQLYDQKKFDTPYIRDFLLDRGAAGDVSETAAPWSKLINVYNAGVAAVEKAYEEIGTSGWIMCHLSHSYHSGACLYFTFAFVYDEEKALEQYDVVKHALQQSFVDNGGTLSHHHAVGVEHAPWLEQDISAGGVAMMKGVFTAVDGGGNLNPGKIITEG